MTAGRNLTSPRRRVLDGCIVVIAEQVTGERETHVLQGVAPIEGVRALAAEMDARDGDWRIVCYSTPNTIYADLQGREMRGAWGHVLRQAPPEVAIATRIGRLDLLPVRPVFADSDGRRKMRSGGT